jgi:cysteine-rich repeat protein
MRRAAPWSRLVLAAVCLVLASTSSVEAARYKLARTFTDPVVEESFGSRIVEGGGRIVIAAPYEQTSPRIPAGAAYVFDAATGAFIRRLASPVAGGQTFGSALAIIGDVLVVGESYGMTGPGSFRGLVHFFDAASGALIRTVPNPSTDPNRLGFGTSLEPIGDRIAVSAPSTFTEAAPANEIFVLDVGSGEVVQTLQQPAENSRAVGFGVALAHVGGVIVAGNPNQRPDYSHAGVAYVYDAASGEFTRTLDNPEPFTIGQFGWAMASVGGAVAIAAPSVFESIPPLGAVFVMDPTTGALLRTLRSPNPNPLIEFGVSLAPVGDLLLVGATTRLDGEGSGAFLFDPATGALLWDFTPLAATRVGKTVASDGRDLLVQGLVGDNSVVFHFIPTCGDGVVDSCETCDDGNTVAGDGCDATCMLESCGNGVLDPGEQCDDGNGVDGDGCDHGCFTTGCGNCVVTAGEECDDGNDSLEDHCDPNCTVPRCGNGVVGIHETCDDANTLGGDGCSAQCKIEACGDGFVDAGESCDDGNRTAGDGCDADCRLETARLGWWKPVFAVPDTTKVSLYSTPVVTPAGILVIDETGFDSIQAELFDATTGALLHTFPELNAFTIASFGGDIWIGDYAFPGVVNRYDGATFALRQSYVGPQSGLVGGFGGAVALVGDHVLVQNGSATVEVFDAATGAHQHTLERPDTADADPFGAVILGVGTHAVVSGTSFAYLFDPATGAYVATLTAPKDEALIGSRPVVLDDRVLLAGPAGVVYVFDGATGALVHTFKPPGGKDLAFGKYIAVRGDAVLIIGMHALHVFDPNTYALRRTIPDPGEGGCFGYTIFDTPFGWAVSDVCTGENFNGIVYVFDHDDGHLVAALPNERGGDSESLTRALGAYGTTLLVWHQDDEDGFGAVVRAYKPCDDGVLEPGEECDDGNVVSGDGCDLSCTLTRCGNGIVTAGEECDDGNRVPGDGCENDCTRSPDICTGVRLEDARLTVRHVRAPLGDETLVVTGHLVPPAGTALDPLAAAARGAELRIADATGAPLLDVTIPAGERGAACGPQDGWRTEKDRAIYTNATNALDEVCTPGSAQGLRRLVIRRRAPDGGVNFRLRVGPSPIADPAGALAMSIGLGAAPDSTCGAQTFDPLDCERAASGTVVVCR